MLKKVILGILAITLLASVALASVGCHDDKDWLGGPDSIGKYVYYPGHGWVYKPIQ